MSSKAAAMRKKIWIRKMTGIVLTLALTVPLAAACTKDSGADDKTERTLRIATYSGPDDEYFRQQFSDTFEITHSNIKIELVPIIDYSMYSMPRKEGEAQPDPLVKMQELMEGPNPPDIVMLQNLEQLPELVSKNMLLQLDPLITKEKYNTSDFVPAVIDGLKDAGDGKLYALSPLFTSSVLMYNKALFNEAGVSFPKDNMTWTEIFELARRVTKGEGENRKYGFAFNPYPFNDSLFYELGNYYTNTLGVRMFNDAGDKMTVDSDQWEKVWKTMQGLVKDKIMPGGMDPNQMMNMKMMPSSGGEFNPFQNDLFKSGKLAMVLAQSYQINDMIAANKNAANYPGYTPIDWDIVTVPQHEEAKGVGGNFYMSGLMGINAKAQNQKDAWAFLKFVNGEDWAKLKSRSVSQMVSRKKYIQPRDGLSYNVQAFYSLKPGPANELNELYRKNPNVGQVQGIGQQYFKQAMDGTKGVRESLKEWQTAGNSALQQLKDNPNMPFPMGARPGVIMY
ncbi:ABC transporter substrate-binding protein [Paenibacillus koleovorans]|uniref:ABC transporter substrate-binding protein n=1 Tax=Paenibacillus koleovorans TaxID=121608 RepID=UPI001FE529DE|nr:extracellular solute-binding protein [Paenibacillus koleovorans]